MVVHGIVSGIHDVIVSLSSYIEYNSDAITQSALSSLYVDTRLFRYSLGRRCRLSWYLVPHTTWCIKKYTMHKYLYESLIFVYLLEIYNTCNGNCFQQKEVRIGKRKNLE